MSRWEKWKKWKTLNVPSTQWGSTRDHITVHRPMCSECAMPAAAWQRCKCRAYFARCKDHQPGAVAEMRRAHQCREARA